MNDADANALPIPIKDVAPNDIRNIINTIPNPNALFVAYQAYSNKLPIPSTAVLTLSAFVKLVGSDHAIMI